MAISMFTSGHSGELQRPENSTAERFGWGITIDAKYGFEVGTVVPHTEWIHFPIPTPVFQPTPQSITAVHLDFLSDGPLSGVLQIDVWDGRTRIATFPGLFLTGNNPAATFAIPSTPLITRGIGVSVLFVIPRPASGPTQKVTFFSIGADFR
jgi:hypothetical protein